MKLCQATKETQVFSHYAFGDPLPVYARYLNSDGNTVKIEKAASVYIRCEREEGHPGAHMAFKFGSWEDLQTP